MEYRRVFLVVSLALSCGVLHAQGPLPYQDSVRDIISEVLYEKKIFEIIFFDHKGEGKWPHRLPDGKFAYIVADTTFGKFYPDIALQLAWGWGKERTLNQRTFIKKAEGSVLLNGDLFFQRTIRLVIRIDSLKIDGSEASLDFHTTSLLKNEEMLNRYVRVNAKLKKKKRGKDWKVKSLSITNYPCCDVLYPGIPLD